MSQWKTVVISLMIFISAQTNAATYQVTQGSFSLTGNRDGNEFPNNYTTILGNGLITDGQYGPSGLDTFIWYGDPQATYFSETVNNQGFLTPPPSININDLTADFSSFIWFRNGTEYQSGGIAQLTSIDDYYRAEWSSIVVGGAFDGFTAEWTLNIKPIPLPAAIWLFSSGLIVILGIMKRKTA